MLGTFFARDKMFQNMPGIAMAQPLHFNKEQVPVYHHANRIGHSVSFSKAIVCGVPHMHQNYPVANNLHKFVQNKPNSKLADPRSQHRVLNFPQNQIINSALIQNQQQPYQVSDIKPNQHQTFLTKNRLSETPLSQATTTMTPEHKNKSLQRPVDRPLEIDCWNTAVSGWEQASLIKSKIGLLVGGRYKILQSIASGSYGEIFAAEDMQNCGLKRQRVAVKFDAACRDDHLKYEYKVYKSALYEDGRGKIEGFPKVYWYGHEYGHNIMVMELLGAPIASLFSYCGRKFGKQTIMEIGEQMLRRIKHIHQRGFIHRDIKPENFLMGLDEKENICHLIDFGLARRYRFRDNRNLVHIPFRRGRFFVGTAKYASLNSHRNIELSRRDDLESLAYVLIELINGQLPWKNISKQTRLYSSQKIRMMKEQTNWSEFCPCMANFVRYCREIPFNEEVVLKHNMCLQ